MRKNNLPPEEFPMIKSLLNEDEKTNKSDVKEIRLPEIFDGQDESAMLQNTGNAAPDVSFIGSNSRQPNFADQTPQQPESTAETTRKSGLAMSAAIALFGSVVFLLIVGWFADLLLGTSPWGIVAGIVLGSIIGFFQFFKTTSQIIKSEK